MTSWSGKRDVVARAEPSFSTDVENKKATHAGNNEVPQGPRLKGALCLARGWTIQVFQRKTAK